MARSFVNNCYLCSTCDTGICKGRKWEGLLWNFFEHSKEILRPALLNALPSGQAFAIVEHCSVNGNEAKFKV